jgi:hypothetical protein
MMTLILPGYSPSNRNWAISIKEHLKLPGSVVVHEWRHWQGGSFNLKCEVSEILTIIGTDKVNFIAKSVGTRVLMSAIPEIKDQVEKVVLCGIPVDPIRYVKGIKQIGNKNLLIIQNSKDPFIPYKLIKTYIGLIDKKIKVVEKKAANHDYPYYSDFQEFLTSQNINEKEEGI